MTTESLNARLRACTTFGQLRDLIEEAADLDLFLISKRTAWGAHRKLFGVEPVTLPTFITPRRVDPLDPEATRVTYLYDDGVNWGEADVKNVWRVASFA